MRFGAARILDPDPTDEGDLGVIHGMLWVLERRARRGRESDPPLGRLPKDSRMSDVASPKWNDPSIPFWVSVLEGDHSHPILDLLQAGIWHSHFHRLLNEAVRLMPRNRRGRPSLNPHLWQMLGEGFGAMMLRLVRQMTDTYPLRGPRGVCSLRSLLAEMQTHRHLLTRDAIIAYRATTRPDFPRHDRLVHEVFAEMRRAVPSADDGECMKGTLERLQARLEADCDRLSACATRFLSHAASIDSLVHHGTTLSGVTYGDLWHIPEKLWRIAHFVRLMLTGQGQHPLYVAADLLEGLESPFVTASTRPAVEALHGSLSEAAKRWSLTDYATLLSSNDESNDDVQSEHDRGA